MYLVAARPEPEIKKENRKIGSEKSRQSEAKLCLKVCFGVERALTGTPLRRGPSLFCVPHLGHTWPRLASFYTHQTWRKSLTTNTLNESFTTLAHFVCYASMLTLATDRCASPTSCCRQSLSQLPGTHSQTRGSWSLKPDPLLLLAMLTFQVSVTVFQRSFGPACLVSGKDSIHCIAHAALLSFSCASQGSLKAFSIYKCYQECVSGREMLHVSEMWHFFSPPDICEEFRTKT